MFEAATVAKPVLIYNLLQFLIRLLADAAHVFAAKLVNGLEIDCKRLAVPLIVRSRRFCWLCIRRSILVLGLRHPAPP